LGNDLDKIGGVEAQVIPDILRGDHGAQKEKAGVGHPGSDLPNYLSPIFCPLSRTPHSDEDYLFLAPTRFHGSRRIQQRLAPGGLETVRLHDRGLRGSHLIPNANQLVGVREIQKIAMAHGGFRGGAGTPGEKPIEWATDQFSLRWRRPPFGGVALEFFVEAVKAD
jgi:hypothetical protein